MTYADPSFSKNYEDAERRALIDNTAQDVFNVLKDLTNLSSLHAARWIWELLQNALDAAAKGRGLRVTVALTANAFIFRHNGSPFTMDQVAHLIRHGSTKYQQDGQVGRFGTGFLSTHIISKVPTVSGLLEDGKSFRFQLDRTGDSPKALTESMNRSSKAFVESVNGSPHESPLTTEYSYPLTHDSLPLAVRGTDSLDTFAPYVLTFNPQIEVIEIERDGHHQTYRRGEGSVVSATCRIIPVWVRTDGALATSCRILAASTPDVTVAVMAQRAGGGTAVRFGAGVPRFFMAFPMFGTESFGFPGVINSDAFRPKPERNGVYLGPEKVEDNEQNKKIIETACVLLLETLGLSARRRWLGVDALCKVGTPAQERGLDYEWLRRTTKEQLVEPMRNVALVPVLNGLLAAARSVWIPTGTGAASSSDVWDAASEFALADTRLVEKNSAGPWAENVKLWADVLGLPVEDMAEALTPAKLAERAREAATLEGLAALLRPASSAAGWADKLFGLLHKAGLSSLFDRLPLLPDQLGKFRIRKDIAIDGGIDGEIKDIADLLGEPLRTELLHPDIHCAEVHGFLSTKNQKEAIHALLTRLLNESQKADPVEGYREANARLFAWLLRHDQLDELASFPAMTREPAVEGQPPHVALLTGKDQDTDAVPLAPPELWHNGAQPFAELFPQRHILASDYHVRCPDDEKWRGLADRGLVRLTPVFPKSDIVSAFVPDETVDEDEDHRSKEAKNTTDIAFLRSDKGGLLDAARKSRVKSLLLLRFLMQHVVLTDKGWQESAEAECQCGKCHKFLKASWLEPLRKNKWVFIERNRSEPPSASSLSKLTKGEPEIIKLLADGDGTKFLAVLGVSAGDFLIQSVTGDDEETRVSLSRSLVEMFQAVGQDAEQIHDLAQEIASHPDTIAELRERQKTRERVRRNQGIGKKVEEAFQQAFGEGHGLTVKRFPVGADYTVEPENDYLDDSGREIVLEIGRFYVEIKATTVDHVRLTDVQARNAADNSERFVLCAVPLADLTAPIDADVIIRQARFVTDIGEKVRLLVEGVASLNAAKRVVLDESGPVALEMQGETVRYRVDQEVWEGGISFVDVVAHFGGKTA